MLPIQKTIGIIGRVVPVSLFLLRIQAVPEHDKALVEEFGNEVQNHIGSGGEVFIPAPAHRVDVFQPGGKRCEDQVIGGHLQHGNRHVCRRLEREFPVQGEIPEHGKHKGNHVA